MAKDYHGPVPVTDKDKKMAKEHLDRSDDLADEKKDLLLDKIKDHAKAMKNAVKEGNTASLNYNRTHKESHENDLDDVDKEHEKIHKSLSTLGSLRTHSRKTYNDVRKAKVRLIYRKAGMDNGR